MIALALAVTACATPSPASTTTPLRQTTTAPSTTVAVAKEINTGDVVGFEVTEIRIDGTRLLVAVADSAERRSRGLMGVRNLGDLQGMIFTWGGETTTSPFTMRNTLITLDIAFFDTEGELVDFQTMTPCVDEPCPIYEPAGPYSYAVEMPDGTLPGLEGARLVR